MPTPKFSHNWSELKARLREIDPETDKNIGKTKTLVHSITLQEYNSKYAILKTPLLTRWFKNRPLVNETMEMSDSDEDEEEQKDVGEHQQQEEGEEVHENSGDGSVKILCASSVDALLLNDPGADEYAQYNDEDEEEELSVYAKNRAKIQSNAPKTTNMPPPSTTTSTATPIRRSSAPCPDPPQRPTISMTTPPAPVPPKEPAKADWTRTRLQLDKRDYHIVWKDLNHFKEQAKTDPLARAVVKDYIIKAFADDKTGPLIDVFKFITETSFYHEEPDTDLWSEIIKRFKRKLKPPGMMVFKTNDNAPDTVLHQYKMAFKEARDYLKNANITLSLQYGDYEFLVTFDNVQPDIKPRIKIEIQENTDPEDSRTVALGGRKPNGKEVFNITRSTDTLPRKPFSNKL